MSNSLKLRLTNGLQLSLTNSLKLGLADRLQLSLSNSLNLCLAVNLNRLDHSFASLALDCLGSALVDYLRRLLLSSGRLIANSCRLALILHHSSLALTTSHLNTSGGTLLGRRRLVEQLTTSLLAALTLDDVAGRLLR